jgi:glycosyltransferase involved in cell wall biosynthesis
MDISVVICTRNRCASLKKALSSLADQSFPSGLSWEIVVVDNDSADQTRAVLEEFMGNFRLPTRCVLEKEAGVSNARNRGIRESKGNIIAFIDDDVIAAPDWLASVKAAFDNYDCACVGGKILLHATVKLPSWWDERCKGPLSLFDVGDSVIVSDVNSWAEIGWGANLSFRRWAFESHGLFRTDLGKIANTPRLGEETEFIDRLRRNGETLVHYPRAVVYHAPNLDRLSRQYLRRWYYRVGETDFVRQPSISGDVIRVFRVPRWKYRVALGNLWQALYSALAGNRKRAFWEQLQLIRFSGYFVAAQKRYSA